MNVLIFEYITGGGLVGEALPACLVQEGELMLAAVAKDFLELPDIQVSALSDARLKCDLHEVRQYFVNLNNGYEKVIDTLADDIDALLIIAPETDNILTSLCEKYSNREFILLNCVAETISLLSDKFATYEYMQSSGVAQIPSYELSMLNEIRSEKIIIKPKDGVGCEGTRIIENNSKLPHNYAVTEKYLAQPYIRGQNASLSLLCWKGSCVVLSANMQKIVVHNDSLCLKECRVNALDREEFITFCDLLVKKLPGLNGYVGADIIITQHEVLLVEINPRLTTSYVGLRSALGLNPAELMLEMFIQQRMPKITPSKNDCVTVGLGEKYAA